MKSLWKQDIAITANKELEHDIGVNTVIIGAGLAGVLTAYLLQKKGIDTVVLEAARIAGGQTQNTTAKITSQHGLFYSEMIRKIGKKRIEGYARANEEAISRFEEIIKEEKIECDFERLPAILYTTESANTKILQKEAEIAGKLGINAKYKEHLTDKNDMTYLSQKIVNVKGAVIFENQAQFHPLKFLKAIAKQLTIYENTPVLSVKGHTVYTDRGKIEADHIVFATHYPFINVPGFYFGREHQERSYVLALKDMAVKQDGSVPRLHAMYYSMDRDGLSIRSHGEHILLGGGNHRTGKKTTCKNEEVGYTFLRKMKDKYFPETEIVAAWSAQDCMPHDDIPFIGRYSVFRPYWYVASGFKKWGMTSSLIAAEIISTDIRRNTDCGLKTEESECGIARYADVFSPQRILFRASFCKFMVDVWESVAGLCKGAFGRTQRRCPHMGCHLEWNDEEKSWDCPCHGSRFSNEGELIDNPAQIDYNVGSK